MERVTAEVAKQKAMSKIASSQDSPVRSFSPAPAAGSEGRGRLAPRPLLGDQAEAASQSAHRMSWARLVLVLSVLLLLVPALAVAADLEVTCDKSNGSIVCDSTPLNGALFDEGNLLPGDTVIRSLQVTNNHDEPCGFALDTKNEVVGVPYSLAGKLWTVIRDVAGDWYGVSDGSGAASDKAVSDAFAAGPIPLGTLDGDSVTDYQWAVTFDEATGNDWQKEETTFNFDMVFTCDEGVVGGGGDETDCCPGPDEPGGGQVLGVVGEEEPPGGIIGAVLERFPTAGVESAAKWLAGEGKGWSRLLAAALAMMLTALFMIRMARLSGKYQASKHK